MMLNKEEICEELIKETKIFHFGTLSMTHEGVREATKEAIRIAEESGALISFDPNLRPPLWNSAVIKRLHFFYHRYYAPILQRRFPFQESPYHYPCIFNLNVSSIMYFLNQIIFHYIDFSCTISKERNSFCLLFCKYNYRHNLLAIVNKYFCAESVQNHTKL